MKKNLIKELDELENSHWWHITKRNIFEKYIQDKIDKSKKKITILEIGAGAGNILAQFKDKANVIALDPDSSAISYCKKRGIKQTIQKTLEEYKDYKPESIDVIIAADVLEHIKNDKEAVRKIYGMLRKGGLFIVHVPADQSLFSYWDKELGHFRRYSYQQLKKLLGSQSFDIRVIRHRVSLPYPFVKIFRKIKGSFIQSEEAQSDFKNFAFMNSVMKHITTLEDKLASSGVINAPFGLSLFSVSIKK